LEVAVLEQEHNKCTWHIELQVNLRRDMHPVHGSILVAVQHRQWLQLIRLRFNHTTFIRQPTSWLRLPMCTCARTAALLSNN